MRPPILYISGPYSPGYGRSTEDIIAVARRYAVAAARKGEVMQARGFRQSLNILTIWYLQDEVSTV